MVLIDDLFYAILPHIQMPVLNGKLKCFPTDIPASFVTVGLDIKYEYDLSKLSA